MAKARKGETEPTFEESLQRLEQVVAELEGTEVPLERAIILFEEGVVLGRRCSGKLDEAERKITMLLEKADGTLVETDFDSTKAPAEETPPVAPAAGVRVRAPAKELRRQPPSAPAKAPRPAESLFDVSDDDAPDDVPF